MIRFIDDYRDHRSGTLKWGIEPICAVLPIAPSSYHAAKKRPPSARAIRDATLKPEVLRVWEQNLAVYGADKVWDQLNKDGIVVARCTVERLMAELGLQGYRAAGGAGSGSAPPSATRRSTGPLTSSSGSSGPPPRTGCGSLT